MLKPTLSTTQYGHLIKQQGYIALLTVMLLGSVFSVLALGLVVQNSNQRTASFDNETKEQGRQLNSACVAKAALKYVLDNSYKGNNETLTVGTGQCTIVSVTSAPNNNLTIVTKALTNDLTTTWQSTFNLTSMSVSSQIEIIN